MSNPFLLGTLGNCGCCNSACGSLCFDEAGCGGQPYKLGVAGSAGGALAGIAIALDSGGAITALTDTSHGSGYTFQPAVTVTGDGCGAVIRANWSGTSSNGNSGAISGGTWADDASLGTISWSNPSHAAAADGIVSICSLSTGDTGHYHKTTNFGFAVPAGASVVGIKFEVKADTSNSVAIDDHVRLVVGGTITGSNLATGTVPIGGTYTVYGGPTTLWGLTPTAAQVNASNFGAVINYTDPDVIQGDDVSIDHTRITVYWTTAAGISGYTIVAGGVGYTTATLTVVGNGTGAAVSVATYSAVVSVGTCTTSRIVYAIASFTGGTGYTTGTGYTLGFTGGTPSTAAAGTFDVVAGHATNLVLTDHGAAYAAGSTPTVSFPGAGTPSVAATATLTMKNGCCFGFTAGTVYVVRATVARLTIPCQPVALVCPNKYTISIVATPAAGYVCAQPGAGVSLCDLPLAKTLYVTDGTGTYTMTWSASFGGFANLWHTTHPPDPDYRFKGATMTRSSPPGTSLVDDLTCPEPTFTATFTTPQSGGGTWAVSLSE